MGDQPEEERDTLIHIGAALTMIQAAEGILGTVINLVFHSSERIRVTSLEAEEESLRRQTLGRLVGELQRRADVHPSVEALLSKFLTTRNEFVHHLSEVERTRGKDAARLLINRAFGEGYAVVRFLSAILWFWAQNMKAQVTDLDFPLPPELSDVEDMMPQVPYLIRRK